jgi:Ni/Fe-hydrogenase subunit HybB-like protein
MKRYVAQDMAVPVDALHRPGTELPWTLKEKLLLGLTPRQYWASVIRNPFNWAFAVIFAVGIPVLVLRFYHGLGYVTHSSYDYPWGLLLSWGLFTMVPLSASGFMMGTVVELFGRKDFKPLERLGLLNGLLGYFFAVIFLQVDLGQPWRLVYPMFVSLGPAAVLFLVAWHVATYLSVQIAELVPAFSEWIGYSRAKRVIKSMVLGLTVAGIILSTLHQGALGALFTYAPGKVHPLWFSAEFQWIYFFVSAIFGGLCMLIVVSTLAKWFMSWRMDKTFITSLDSLTLGLGKGASLALITYFVIKIIGVAHDNNWHHLATGWGQYFMFEMLAGVILPLVLFVYAIRNNKPGIARLAAFVGVFGIALNRLNTSLITFNYHLYQEIPHWREIILVITLYASYILVYRAVLARLPILYSWKPGPEK